MPLGTDVQSLDSLSRFIHSPAGPCPHALDGGLVGTLIAVVVDPKEGRLNPPNP